ncbi:MAG: exodeoxyribonuclease VII small subunit [Anaerolineales bacterium]|jgi:exodeoxyribonuclease VII small subunit
MAKDTPAAELTYEKALEELETIVTALESGEHPLDEALALFERGQSLYLRCTELLDHAELKVRQLTEEGELKDFDG